MFKKRHNKKLIYLSYSRIPSPHANSLQVMEMCSALSEQGYEVELYALKTSEQCPIFEYYDLKEGSFIIHRIWMPRIKLISRFLYGIRVAINLLLNEPASIFFGRDFYTMALLSVLRVKPAPIYFEAHQPPSNRLEKMLQGTLFKNSNFAGLITISEALKVEYIRLFPLLALDKIQVLHDAARYRRQERSQSIEENLEKNIRIGYVGSLQVGKGMELISKIAIQLPDIDFHIVGGQKDQISNWEKKATANITFHGHQPSARVHSLMQQFDIVLAPYQQEVFVGKKQMDIARWMSPLKIFEYMSAARAIVASDLPVLREVLHHQKNALLADPSDVNDWVKKIRILQADSAVRIRLGQQAYQDFEKKYTWQKRAEVLKAMFVKRLNKRKISAA